MKQTTAVMAALLALAAALQHQSSAQSGRSPRAELPFQVGQPFPVLLLPRLSDGKPGSIADYRGKKVLLHVFASW